MGNCGGGGGSGGDGGGSSGGSGGDGGSGGSSGDGGGSGSGGSDAGGGTGEGTNDGSTGSGSCMTADITLETDSRGYEMGVFLYDFEDFQSQDFEQAIIAHSPGNLESNQNYVFEELCFDRSTCYMLFLVDEGSDGFLSGGLALSVDGASYDSVGPDDQWESLSTGGTFWVTYFGNCQSTSSKSAGGTSKGSLVSKASSGGSFGGSSCFDTVIELATDSDADEMAIAMIDVANMDAAGDPTVLFAVGFGSLQDNAFYLAEDICLDNSGCYVIFLLDQGADGFVGGGSLQVTVNNDLIMSVGPEDFGTYDSEIGASYWFIQYGSC
jgi:hypothetical protein